MLQKEQWQGFNGRIWREEINLREFIQDNYTPYDGDASFLEGPTEATDTAVGRTAEACRRQSVKRVVFLIWILISYQALLPINRVTFLKSLKEKEQIVGLQTDKPLKRAFMPFRWYPYWLKKLVQLMVTQPNPELPQDFYRLS